MIADLPGYGYAKVSIEARNKWQKYLEEYLLKREQIHTLVQLVDARHEIQKNDFQNAWMGIGLWFTCYNSCHKNRLYFKKTKIQSALAHVRKEFGGEIFPFSAVDNRYNEKILEFFTSK